MAVSLKDASKFDLRCRMRKEEFKKDVEDGCITDYDGLGYWGTENKVSNIDCFYEAPENMDYVYWYNK